MGSWLFRVAAVILMMPATAVSVDLHFNDPLANEQWYHDEMGFNDAWGRIYSQRRRGQVTVAVLDSGFETAHSDLDGNLVHGVNIVDGSSNIEPVHPHGTGTGGIPGAESGNGAGISQTAWTANILPIRISNRKDAGAYLSDIDRAIRYAADNGARIINISYGGVGERVIGRAAAYAYRKGALVFMAAGNSGMETRWRNYRQIVAVGSIGPDGQRSSFSTYGRFLDFVAPGEDVTTLYTDDGFASWNGTSFASPIAASVASLVLTANPELSPAQVLRILRKTATPLGEDLKRRDQKRQYGFGLLDADAAVELALKTRGAYRNRLRRRGIDPWVPNDVADIGAMTAVDVEALAASLGSEASADGQTGMGEPTSIAASLTDAQAATLGLVLPQGFATFSSSGGVSAIPEPSTIVLALAGMGMILLGRRKRPR